MGHQEESCGAGESQEEPGEASGSQEKGVGARTPGDPERISKNQESLTLLLGWLMNISRVCVCQAHTHELFVMRGLCMQNLVKELGWIHYDTLFLIGKIISRAQQLGKQSCSVEAE